MRDAAHAEYFRIRDAACTLYFTRVMPHVRVVQSSERKGPSAKKTDIDAKVSAKVRQQQQEEAAQRAKALQQQQRR